VDHDSFISSVKFAVDGLVPAVLQDATSGQVLMLAYMNAESLALTLTTGEAHFWSRSRRELWHKGATSGNVQRVRHVQLDCDHDALLLQVEPLGPACHTGATSCFSDEASDGASATP
jgi:phosphoribosyl-ATP pyrophosphohydrolase/phosphoribosyl-AMP cyclohydrolase